MVTRRAVVVVVVVVARTVVVVGRNVVVTSGVRMTIDEVVTDCSGKVVVVASTAVSPTVSVKVREFAKL